MQIEKEYIINDEPWISTATGIRKINLVYKGPRYLYAEVDHLNKVQVITHISDTVSDMAAALEKLTPIEGRSIVEIDAEQATLAASYFWSSYSFSLDDYVENLSNGQTYTYNYSDPPLLTDIYDFNKMTFDKSKKDFTDYKFVVAPVSDSEMIASIDSLISKIELAKIENTLLTSSDLTELDRYIANLNQFKTDMSAGIEHWKMPFPICSIPY